MCVCVEERGASPAAAVNNSSTEENLDQVLLRIDQIEISNPFTELGNTLREGQREMSASRELGASVPRRAQGKAINLKNYFSEACTTISHI